MFFVSSAMLGFAPTAVEWHRKFQPLRTLLEGWEFTTEYAITVGTADGPVFRYESGNFTNQKVVPTGSTSKWPSAMMFASLVDDGSIGSLDTLVSDILPFWTKDKKDHRSEVTLRHLLTFTSGFGDGHPGLEGNTRAARAWRAEHPNASVPEASLACNTELGDTSRCARWIYEHVKQVGRPGHVYSYNSYHLQLAAGVAVAATGLGIHDVIQKYLLTPFGLKDSYYAGRAPDPAGSLMTTGDDYAKFLHGLLAHVHPSKALIEASEQDATPFLAADYSLYGDYGFGHFLSCFDSTAGFTAACAQANVHMDPGAFGFIPILDRKNGYYLQLAAAEFPPTGSYPLSGIPEYLAVALKPHVDAILSAAPPPAAAHAHHTPALLSLTIADVNYILDCKLHPENCS